MYLVYYPDVVRVVSFIPWRDARLGIRSLTSQFMLFLFQKFDSKNLKHHWDFQYVKNGCELTKFLDIIVINYHYYHFKKLLGFYDHQENTILFLVSFEIMCF